MSSPLRVQLPALGDASMALSARSRAVFPDGTTRVTVERDPLPRFISHGRGAYLYDVDGKGLLDLNNNFTTLIHGHGYAPVIEAVQRQLVDGACFANPTQHEIALAELIVSRVPGIEKMRFVNSGTEAVMYAVKAARALTGKPAIAKFEGAYHGGYDVVEISQASTPANWGSPEEPARTRYYKGSPASGLDDAVILRFNDTKQSLAQLHRHADRIAALVIDPMPSRAGLVAPEPDFIQAVQACCKELGILVIVDEVLNFRQGYAGASPRYGIWPDLMVFGKIIGGGFPIGAIAGRSELMQVFSAEKGRPAVPQGGTFSANPVSMVAGLVSMQAMTPAAYEHLEALGELVRRKLIAAIEKFKAPFSVTGAASLFRIHAKSIPPREYREAYPTPKEESVLKHMWRFFQAAGINLPHGAAASLSTPMTNSDIEMIAETFELFLKQNADLIAELRQ